MCGVAGIIDYSGDKNNVAAVSSMLRTIRHRGPDESGIYNSPCATIGNVRLSIIDIAGGQQPMSDSSGRYQIVFNGEIFNYRELRDEITGKGIRLRTESDTEVLVQLYAIYGQYCLPKLNGQFAFAIWDRIKEELFLARDRVGIRPLFYNLTEGVFTFGSEIKAIFSQEFILREFSPQNLAQIYTFWSAVTPNTAFKNVFELPPGHFAIYNRQGLYTERFWQLEIGNKMPDISADDASERFNELLTGATRLRLRADVEVAAYLSGGLDSSATVALIKQIEPGVLNTFSIGFTEKDFDESSYQKEAVKYLDTNHRSIVCTPDDIAGNFPAVVWHSEIPVLRTAPAPMMILSGLVRENGIKVVITGEGSDEILAGYDIFREAKIRRFWAEQPESALRPALLKRIYPDIPHLRNASPSILKMFFGYKLNDTENPYYSHLLRWNNSNHILKHFTDNIKTELNGYSPINTLSSITPPGFEKWEDLAKAQWLETTIFMSGYLLSSQGDRMGMANSVEGRYPFLDHRVVEFCAGLPPGMKLRGLNEKYLLKKTVKGKIPDSIIARPKQPYRAPVTSSFLSEGAPDYIAEMLSEKYSDEAGIFNHNSIQTVKERIARTGNASEMDNMVLAAVISTHLLHHQFIKNNNSDFMGEELKNLKLIEEK